MINLLPPDQQAAIVAGRTNRLLVSYSFALLMLLAVIAMVFAGTWLYLSSVENQANADVQDATTQASAYADEQQQISTFKSDLATSKQILTNRIDYSTVVLRIASTIPSGVVLDNLTLNKEQFGAPMMINAHARSEADAIRLKDSLNDSAYFSDVSFESLTRSQDGTKYGYSVVLTATPTMELINE